MGKAAGLPIITKLLHQPGLALSKLLLLLNLDLKGREETEFF